jgi:phage-related minor tail protein
MATVKQVQYRLGQAKKTLAKLTKGLAAAKAKVKKLEAQLKKVRVAEKARPKRKARPKAKARRSKPKAKARRRTAARRRS